MKRWKRSSVRYPPAGLSGGGDGWCQKKSSAGRETSSASRRSYQHNQPGAVTTMETDRGPVTRTLVTIYGEEYPLVSDLPPEAVHALGRMVDTRIRNLAARHPRVSTARLTVLAALTLAEELARTKAEHAEAVAALQAQWRRESPARRTSKGGQTS
jgi:cell division protein ZapA